jgi:glycosyltransferase involved in cell wall biosynthesis
MGRLKRYKRVDLVIRAVARLRDQDVPVKLLVAGKGDHRDALEREARSLGLGDDRVRFLGFVPDDEKVDLLRRSWIHVLTSPKEGWGIVNLEAAACGTPTVASDSPGLRDSVRDGSTGFLVPHGDLEALADRLRTVLQAPDLRERMGMEALEFAGGFGWDASARAMETFLDGVARSR